MNRRAGLTLTTMALLFLAALLTTAVPKIGLAQSNPLIGTWELNLAKSKYSGASPPRSTTLPFTAEGQNLALTADTIDAQGQMVKTVFSHIYDGKPHPTTGVPGGARPRKIAGSRRAAVQSERKSDRFQAWQLSSSGGKVTLS